MEPPKPRLFRAIAFLGILLGSVGAMGALGNLAMLSRAEHDAVEIPGFGAPTEAQAKITRKVQARVERVIERHRAVSAALHIANVALSLLLLAGGLTLASRRTWSHALMVQALAASVLYEIPSVIHDSRLAYESMLAVRRFFPEMLAAQNLPAPPEQIAIMSGGFLLVGVAIKVGLAGLRMAYYGTGLWYLRRSDVKAWFATTPDL